MQQQITAPDMDRHAPLPSKGRKSAPTGGNRSWSEEEENYLLQTRAQKMPYKHIAAHLKKTELACRLHYHQLSHGNHRRKRTSSVSSSNSSVSSARHSPTQYHLANPFDPEGLHGSPQDYFSGQTLGSYPHMNPTLPGSRIQHKVLLPKPRPITPEESPNRMAGLRINTGLNGSPDGSVDTDRLRQIYDNHRNNFWSAIAAEYGQNVNPSQLEDIWRHGPPIMRPPTPSESPESRGSSSLLKPSPFPQFPTLESSRDFGSFSAPSHVTMPVQDRFGYQHYQVTSGPTGPYQPTPILPGQLSRTNSWSTPAMNGMGMAMNPHHTLQSQHPASQSSATAITSLLTDNKCPRHGEYCVGGHCLN